MYPSALLSRRENQLAQNLLLGRNQAMSRRSRRQNLAQGEASAASGTLGIKEKIGSKPALAGDRRLRTALCPLRGLTIVQRRDPGLTPGAKFYRQLRRLVEQVNIRIDYSKFHLILRSSKRVHLGSGESINTTCPFLLLMRMPTLAAS